MKNNKLILWLLIIVVAYSFMQNRNQDDSKGDVYLTQSTIGVATQKTDYRRGKEIILKLQNNTDKIIELPISCDEEPFDVYRYENGDWIQKSIPNTGINCEDTTLTLQTGKGKTVTYKNWAYRLFGETGRYKIEVSDNEKNTYTSNEFTVQHRRTIGALWLKGIYRPILNGLIYLVKVIPGNSLGLAIIILTLLIRTILLIPSQRAMRSQKKMQVVQAKIEELKKKHKGNQEKIALETVALWKEHKVNPFGSCLLMFVQFPILIALYYVIREGLHPDKLELLYAPVANGFSFDMMGTHFLGLDLLNINFLVLPFIVGSLQFIQMHLAFARAKKKKANKPQKNIQKKEEGAADMQDQMKMANNMMKYFMPAMIAFFTASMPAGVGLYWGVSTSYGILQQLVINRETTNEKKASEPTVRVIEKND